MYVHRGDLGNYVDALVDLSRPLLVTSVGNICPRSVKEFFTTRPDGREDYQLIYVAEGCVHFYLEGTATETVVEKGHMVVFRPGQPQHYIMYSAEQADFYWIHFTGSRAEHLLEECRIPKDRQVFWAGTSSDYRWMFHQMIKELQTRREHSEELNRLNLRYLLLLLNRHLTETDQPHTDFNGEIIQALTYFERHWREPISIDAYAARNRMTSCWFRRRFKQYTGLAPMQYLVSLRITNARNLLENTDYNIAQVADAVGYDNPSYFRRLFLKYTGMTPTEYKKSRTRS